MHLVLVHGAWHGDWCWNDHFVPYFNNAGYQTTAVTLPGHGPRTDRQSRIWDRMSNYVAAVRETVETIDAPVVVIGHSMGGLTTQRLLERPTPTNVAGAVLMASVPTSGAGMTTIRAARRDPAGVGTAVVSANMWPIIDSEQKVRRTLFSDATPDAIVSSTADRLQNESYFAYLSMILRPGRPATVAAPMLVVAGEKDGLFTTVEQKRIAKSYGAQYIEIPGSGHDIMLDTTWQTAADAILDWLPAVVPGSGI